MSGKDLKIVYMGTPEFAVAPLKSLVNNGYNVVSVITVPDKPQGRGQKLGQSAVKEYALSVGLPVLQPVSLKDEAFLNTLKELNADIFTVVAFRMLPKEVWKMPKLGTFNLHASLLPKYRGAAPINWAIINGEAETGVTTFLIDEKIDTGNILLQSKILIEEKETIGTLYEKLMTLGSPLVLKTIDGLADNALKPVPQSENDNVCGAPKLNKQNCSINWLNSAREIELLVRGLSPYPAALSTLAATESETCREENSKKDSPLQEIGVKIFMASDTGIVANQEILPGTIKSDGKSYLHVMTGNKNWISIEEIQLAGKKRMRIKDLLAGFRNPESYKFL